MPYERLTIKDIAERAGVSTGTVDRVIHNRPNVSKKSLEKVNKVLSEINFEPNMYASALANTRRYDFFCLIPKHESEPTGRKWRKDRKNVATPDETFTYILILSITSVTTTNRLLSNTRLYLPRIPTAW